jgi:hypothetical protein
VNSIDFDPRSHHSPGIKLSQTRKNLCVTYFREMRKMGFIDINISYFFMRLALKPLASLGTLKYLIEFGERVGRNTLSSL